MRALSNPRIDIRPGVDQCGDFGPDVLVVSLGVDSFARDPVGGFALESPNFLRLGADIAALGLPTLFVMEGGYAIAELGLNTANVISGFMADQR